VVERFIAPVLKTGEVLKPPWVRIPPPPPFFGWDENLGSITNTRSGKHQKRSQSVAPWQSQGNPTPSAPSTPSARGPRSNTPTATASAASSTRPSSSSPPRKNTASTLSSSGIPEGARPTSPASMPRISTGVPEDSTLRAPETPIQMPRQGSRSNPPPAPQGRPLFPHLGTLKESKRSN